MKRFAVAFLFLAFSTIAASAQSCFPDPAGTRANCGAPIMYVNGLGQSVAVTQSNPLPISGSFSASLSGFQPSASGARATPLAVTTSDTSGSLPSGSVVVVTNAGSNPAYCNVNGIAATTSDQLITSGGGWFAFTIPGGQSVLHCIATGGATTANMVGGTGLPTGIGGGSGGGGGGGSVTQGTSPWVDSITQWGTVTLGPAVAWGSVPTGLVIGVNANVLASVLPTGAATSANQSTEISSLGAIATNTNGVATAANQATANSSLSTIANNTGGPVPVTVNGTTTPQAGQTQGTAPTGNQTGASTISTPANVSPNDCSATATTTASTLLAASRLHNKVDIAVQGTSPVCFNFVGGTAAAGSAGTVCLKGASGANTGDGGSWSTPESRTDSSQISMIAPTASSVVWCRWQ